MNKGLTKARCVRRQKAKGKDKDLINALNYSRYQTRWFEEKYKRFNKTRDQHFTFIGGLLKKKGMKNKLISSL